MLAPVVVIANGAVGVVGLALQRRPAPRWFMPAVLVGFGLAAVQVGVGIGLLSTATPPGSFHTFYGMVIAFTLGFAYIYRAQLARRRVLGYALIALFVMGLGIRGWMNVGVNL